MGPVLARKRCGDSPVSPRNPQCLVTERFRTHGVGSGEEGCCAHVGPAQPQAAECSSRAAGAAHVHLAHWPAPGEGTVPTHPHVAVAVAVDRETGTGGGGL